jgi:hypothetical protein
MVLMHGGSPKGAELIAARWADNRKVPQVAFKPDWTKHAKAAPFKRNDQMLDVLPIGVITSPAPGIQDNLADKAQARHPGLSPLLLLGPRPCASRSQQHSLFPPPSPAIMWCSPCPISGCPRWLGVKSSLPWARFALAARR